MSDLVEFLRARLDEDEAMAQAATGGPWVWVPDQMWGAPHAASGHPERVIILGRGGYITGDDAAYIARWDPTRVLAEVEAKRRIVDRYDANLDRQTDPEESHLEADINVTEYEDWTLIALAQPYADHPDFDPAWRLA